MTIQQALEKFYAYLDSPIRMKSRLVLALLLIPLALTFTAPLWRISLEASQYPKGLYMDIYAHKLVGGNSGQHIQEINILNHYIGMHKIDRSELSDLDWIPFALGMLGVLTLRVAAAGNVRSLVDLSVITAYVSLFALARFAYKLYVFGHDLDPSAPFKVPPFTPAIFGSKEVANFTTHSYPSLGSAYLGIFAVGVVGVTLFHLITARFAAVRAERAARVDQGEQAAVIPEPAPETLEEGTK